MFGFGKKKRVQEEQDAEAAVAIAPEPAADSAVDSGVDSVVDANVESQANEQAQAPSDLAVEEQAEEPSKRGFFGRLRDGLSRTRNKLSDGLGAVVLGRKEVDASLLEEVETQLLTADVGLEAPTPLSTAFARVSGANNSPTQTSLWPPFARSCAQY